MLLETMIAHPSLAQKTLENYLPDFLAYIAVIICHLKKCNLLKAALGFEPRIKDLQSSALPLGYAADLEGEKGIEPFKKIQNLLAYHWPTLLYSLIILVSLLHRKY